MTEKRFKVLDCVLGQYIKDMKNRCPIRVDEVCEILNNLHEEKEELIDALNQRTEQCDKLYEENEQLKQQIKDMKIRFKRKYDHEFDEIVDRL